MSNEYNSLILAKLYSTSDENEMQDLLEDIANSKDPIFLYPLYEVYKKHKSSSISHYFIISLSELNSNEVIQIGLEIGENSDTRNANRIYTLDIFAKKNFYEQRAIQIALVSLFEFIDEIDTNEYSFYSIISYLKSAGALSKAEDELLSIFRNHKFSTKTREFAFGAWLEIDPTTKLQTIINDYGTIKQDNEQESIIAKVISRWQGPKIEELKKIIEQNGSIKAKHIIHRSRERDEEQKQKASEEKQQTVLKQYSNADLVEKISNLREKINDAAKSNEYIGFIIFPQNESLYLQLKTANDNATLIKACISLRELIQNLNSELGNHGLNIDEIRKLLPDTAEEDFNKSINKLFLFLYSKKFKVDSNSFGLRQLNQLVGLLGAHPSSEKDKLIKKLEAVKLDKAYKEEEWAGIHQGLLGLYINSLDALLKTISEN
jgi:hypothetical protein